MRPQIGLLLQPLTIEQYAYGAMVEQYLLENRGALGRASLSANLSRHIRNELSRTEDRPLMGVTGE
jgi:hypothetical protein